VEGARGDAHDAAEERWVLLPDGRMRYRAAPAGAGSAADKAPLLLIHGLLGSSFSWRCNLPVLAQHFQVYAPDALGAGFSARPEHVDCGLGAAAKRLLQFMDALGIDSADVIGTSHGGAIAALMAERAPERVRRLVLAAPVNPWSRHGSLLIRLLSNRAGAFLFERIAPMLRPLHGYFLRRMYGDPRRIPPGTLQGYNAPLEVPGTLRYLLGVVGRWRKDMKSLQQTYERLGGRRVLLLWGDRDGAVFPESAQELQRRMPGAELVVLPTVGHLPYEEAPEEFNHAVLEFLLRNE
jgi:pimeloyl-ACP methyl ester carboxylesterase